MHEAHRTRRSPTSRTPAPRGPRSAWGWLALALLLVGRGTRPAPAFADGPPAGYLFGEVRPDPDGRATALAADVGRELAAGRAAQAASDIRRLVEDFPDVAVPADEDAVLASDAGDGLGRWCPVRLVAPSWTARLPDGERTDLERRWAGPTGALARRARSGDAGALETLAERWCVTALGREALFALAFRDLAAGRTARAAAGLARWRALAGREPLARRATALAAEADALATLGDQAALARLREDAGEEGDVVVRVGRRRIPARLVVLEAAERSARRSLEGHGAGSAAGTPSLPDDPIALWTLPYDRTSLRRTVGSPTRDARVFAGAAADGAGHLLLDDGRGVVRVEAHTGCVLWRFPPPSPRGAWDVDPRARYAEESLPSRTVDVAGTVVLATLGDPPCTGAWVDGGGDVEVADEVRRSKTRLVALDRDTGRLLWASGQPGDPDAVLGDVQTGVSSPPLVEGDRVYVLFARESGGTELYAACLDLATGRPLWRTFLALASSGRHGGVRSGTQRFRQARVDAPPWGARPSLAGGELCVLPQAGFVAGLDAESGRVHWLQRLPVYGGDPDELGPAGFLGRSPPLAAGGAWVLAPYDAPALVAVDRQSGRWRFAVPGPRGPLPTWSHLLGLSDEPGGPWLRLSGDNAVLVPLHHPEEARTSSQSLFLGGLPRGIPWDAGETLVLAGTRAPANGSMLEPGLTEVPWPGSGRVGKVARAAGIEDLPGGFPLTGDVLPVGDVWVVLGDRGAGAIGSARGVRAWAARASAGPPGAEATAAAALGARLDHDLGEARAALASARALPPGAAEASVEVARGTLDALARSSSDDAVRAASALLRDDARATAARLPSYASSPAFRTHPEKLAAWLFEWIDRRPDALVPVAPGLRVRADLDAARRLRELAGEPRPRDVLAARTERALARLRAAADDPAVLEEVLADARGTPVADLVRTRLAARLAVAGRHAEAALVTADRRLDPATPRPDAGAFDEGDAALSAARRRLADLQRGEARERALAGERERARRLLLDVARWGPEPGRPYDEQPAVVEARELGSAVPGTPDGADVQHFDAWAGVEGPQDARALGSVAVPGLTGPGAGRWNARLALFRGLDLEIWDRHPARRQAVLRDPARGWFGGSLAEVDPWVPRSGALVAGIVASEPADRWGFRAGDWLLAWDGRPVSSVAAFMSDVARSRPGVPIPVTVRREGRTIDAKFTPGERPQREGVLLDRAEVYVNERGRLLVPGRLDVAWVDPDTETRRELWRWREPGVVRAVSVAGGVAVVSISCPRARDVLVAVDLEDGHERWRLPIEGIVERVEPTGSALVAFTNHPLRAWVVGLADGRSRLTVDLLARRPDTALTRTYAVDPTVVTVHGRLWWLSRGSGGTLLRAVNTTTGALEWTGSLGPGLFAPRIAADGVVAVSAGPGEVRILAPDPVTGTPRWTERLAGVGSARGAPPGIDASSRLYLEGSTLWVLRNEAARVEVETWVLDAAALGPGADARAGSAAARARPRGVVSLAGRLDPGAYVFDGHARLDGLFVTAASMGTRPRRAVLWAGPRGGGWAWEDRSAADTGVLLFARPSPARVGSVLALPTDRGADLVPLH